MDANTASPRAAHAAKHWGFTINNPTDDDRAQIDVLADNEICKGITWQLEKGEEGTPHLQGYIALHVRRRLAQLKQHLTRAHLEVARNPAKLIAYCRKEDTRIDGPWTLGDVDFKTKGKRNDLVRLHDTLKSGNWTRDTLFEEHASVLIRYPGGVREIAQHYVPDRFEMTHLIILYGPTGTGKTHTAMHLECGDCDDQEEHPPRPTVFKVMGSRTDPWFDGYDPMRHDTVVFDEYKGEQPHNKFLQLVDKWPHTVEVKGGTVKWRPKNVILTMNNAPGRLYKRTWAQSEAEFDAFWRRVTSLVKITARNVHKHRDVQAYAAKYRAIYERERYNESIHPLDPRREVRVNTRNDWQPPPARKPHRRRTPSPEPRDKRQRTLDDYVE